MVVDTHLMVTHLVLLIQCLITHLWLDMAHLVTLNQCLEEEDTPLMAQQQIQAVFLQIRMAALPQIILAEMETFKERRDLQEMIPTLLQVATHVLLMAMGEQCRTVMDTLLSLVLVQVDHLQMLVLSLQETTKVVDMVHIAEPQDHKELTAVTDHIKRHRL